MKTVEVLFPEVGNLYGDLGNIEFFRRISDDIIVIEDELFEEPFFAENEPDIIYMGTMTESSQVLVIEKLMPYRERIQELMDKGIWFLITGNALEIFGKRIEDKDSGTTECLGLFPFYAKRDMMSRFNSLYLGTFKDGDFETDIVGYKSQFSHSYPEEGSGIDSLFETGRGPGLNPDITGEGIRYKNFMGTYIIGPLLVLNPPFTKWLAGEMGLYSELPFEQDAMKAYEVRVEEYSDPSRGFYY